MNYLLDTHTLIWSITEKWKLSGAVKQTFENPDNSFFVSSINFWEVSLKFSKGKLELLSFLPEDIPGLSLQSGFQVIFISTEEAASYHRLIISNHKDPFDRMLVWQAIQRNLILITKDDDLNQYKAVGLKTLW